MLKRSRATYYQITSRICQVCMQRSFSSGPVGDISVDEPPTGKIHFKSYAGLGDIPSSTICPKPVNRHFDQKAMQCKFSLSNIQEQLLKRSCMFSSFWDTPGSRTDMQCVDGCLFPPFPISCSSENRNGAQATQLSKECWYPYTGQKRVISIRTFRQNTAVTVHRLMPCWE